MHKKKKLFKTKPQLYNNCVQKQFAKEFAVGTRMRKKAKTTKTKLWRNGEVRVCTPNMLPAQASQLGGAPFAALLGPPMPDPATENR